MRLLLLLLALSSLSTAQANIREFVRDYEYIPTPLDTIQSSRVNAAAELKREMLEEVGVYIKSVTTVRENNFGDFAMETDTVSMTAGVVSFVVLEERWNEVLFYIKGSMKTDPEQIRQIINGLADNLEMQNMLRESQAALGDAQRLIEELRAANGSGQKPDQRYRRLVEETEVELRFQEALSAFLFGDLRGALEGFRALAEQGNARAQTRLGHMYLLGVAVETDYDQARAWLEKGAANGSARALALLGVMYDRGLGVQRDLDRALRYYYRGSDLGDGLAYANLGFLYWTGQGVKQDHQKAFEHYSKAVELDTPLAYSRLGTLYDKGQVVPRDTDKAFELYSRGANKGDHHSMAQLGRYYLMGIATEKDIDHAHTLIRRSIRYGSPHGKALYGLMHDEGWGVARDHARARELYLEAAEWGNLLAEFRLGIQYLKGLGVTQDREMAKQWLRKAADKGFEKAREVLERVEAREGSVW